MNSKQDTGFGISLDVIKINGIITTRIVNDLANEEVIL